MRQTLVLLGATATGKSAVALALARWGGGEIVNADALQAYRGLDIGTGKPTPAERASVPHHLFDVLDPRERFSAGEFARRARQSIAEIESRGAWPIVVGGSGFYLRALLDGLSPLPEVPAALRQRLRERAENEGAGALHAELARLDPTSAARLAAADRQRVERALGVTLASGTPFSLWLGAPPGEPRLAARKVGLTLPRHLLYHRIGARVRAMVDGGWLDEVTRLMREGVSPQCPAFQAIGYRELARAVRGECGVEQAVEETVLSTRRFAKRQETWFRRERDVQWVAAEEVERATAQIQRLVDESDAGIGRTHDDDEAQHQHPGRVPVSEPQGGAGGGR
jgi:tRNA dimethylallyltransferase